MIIIIIAKIPSLRSCLFGFCGSLVPTYVYIIIKYKYESSLQIQILPLFVILTVSVCLSLVSLWYRRIELSEVLSGENSLRSTTKSYWPSCVYINGERMLTGTLINEWLTF